MKNPGPSPSYPAWQCFWRLVVPWLALAGASGVPARAASSPPGRPNIVYILADDLGYGDVGCYGQEQIATPHIDRLAAEGMRFTQHYAGNTVCTPSRSSLITGRHPGRVRHRDNPRFVDSYGFLPEETTFAEVMKSVGYTTAICGKWHVGDRADSKDIPHHHGFDHAYCIGYPYPDLGWEHWPSHVFVNGRQTVIPANGGGRKGRYMDDLYTDAAIGFMRENRARPFLLFLSFQGVHAPMDGNISPRYAGRDWPEVEKVFASMLERVDDNVGRVSAALRDLDLDRNTVVFFSSDNGPHREGGHDAGFFRSSGPYRGIKRDLYEGGIRVPLIARWPGVIRAGSVSAHISAQWDMLPTFAELGGARVPPEADGISFAPSLRGGQQRAHPHLYWECRELGGSQAVRVGNWKAVRRKTKEDIDAPIELYDLEHDPAETTDRAKQHPEIVKSVKQIMLDSHVPVARAPLFPKSGK